MDRELESEFRAWDRASALSLLAFEAALDEVDSSHYVHQHGQDATCPTCVVCNRLVVESGKQHLSYTNGGKGALSDDIYMPSLR